MGEMRTENGGTAKKKNVAKQAPKLASPRRGEATRHGKRDPTAGKKGKALLLVNSSEKSGKGLNAVEGLAPPKQARALLEAKKKGKGGVLDPSPRRERGLRTSLTKKKKTGKKKRKRKAHRQSRRGRRRVSGRGQKRNRRKKKISNAIIHYSIGT